eukprot:2846795-Ditylum_brightwellii.AAC.1
MEHNHIQQNQLEHHRHNFLILQYYQHKFAVKLSHKCFPVNEASYNPTKLKYTPYCRQGNKATGPFSCANKAQNTGSISNKS